VFAIVAVVFLVRFVRAGSLVGALLGGSIEQECGEVATPNVGPGSRTVKVYSMRDSSGGAFVGVSLVSKSAFAASMNGFRLTSAQAKDLASLLSRASELSGPA
jgi:hypothetical protein